MSLELTETEFAYAQSAAANLEHPTAVEVVCLGSSDNPSQSLHSARLA